MSKIRIEDIQQSLQKEGWALLSDSYKNLDSEMKFKCPEGHEVLSTWKKMRQNFECPICNQNEFKNQDMNVIPKGRRVTRCLCLDQSTQVTGFSIFDNGKLIRYGVFRATGDNETERIALVKNWLINMISNWKPDHVGIEGIQFQYASDSGVIKKEESHMSVTVFQALARLQGVLLDTCYSLKVPAYVCTISTWRNYCGVKGKTRADRKRSMQALVKEWYDIRVSDDEADAIGIGKYLSGRIGFYVEVEIWE